MSTALDRSVANVTGGCIGDSYKIKHRILMLRMKQRERGKSTAMERPTTNDTGRLHAKTLNNHDGENGINTMERSATNIII